MEKVNMDSLVVVLDTLENWDFNSQFEVNGKKWFHYKQISSKSNEVKIVHLYRLKVNQS
jgi:hypothetical protein